MWAAGLLFYEFDLFAISKNEKAGGDMESFNINL